MKEIVELTLSERKQIAEILERRANDIASFKMECARTWEREGSKVTPSGVRITPELPGPVDFALSREMERLRNLATRIKPSEKVLSFDEDE